MKKKRAQGDYGQLGPTHMRWKERDEGQVMSCRGPEKTWRGGRTRSQLRPADGRPGDDGGDWRSRVISQIGRG